MNLVLKLVSLFLIISQQGYSQSITGFLLDIQSKKPIIGATLTSKNSQEQVISLKDGSFTFSKLSETDSLVIQHINYTTLTYSIAELSSKKTIYLSSKTIVAPQVIIQPKKYKKGILGYRAGMGKIGDGWHTKSGRKRKYSYGLAKDFLQRNAQRIYNDYRYKGYIKKIRVGISKHGKPTTPFGLRLMTVNPLDQSPENDLIDSLFIIAAPKGNDWAELDISKFGIDLPKEGFFVVLEDLPQALDSVWYHEYTYYDTAYQKHASIDTCFGFVSKYYSKKYKDVQDVHWQYYENATTPINDSL
ncbi:MAG: carboxypeptidase-like regulatory domain-containing protein, partial [Aureispira sp.]|nr:carboxypeptidase-like regulatory domain-containing protein [Aureispira sp.]